MASVSRDPLLTLAIVFLILGALGGIFAGVLFSNFFNLGVYPTEELFSAILAVVFVAVAEVLIQVDSHLHSLKV